MDSIRIQGGTSLQGKVRVQGSKNAALPIMAAAIMTGEEVTLKNVPKISDVYAMIRILEKLGCKVSWHGHALSVDPENFSCEEVTGETAKCMRSSVFLLGALLAKCGKAKLENPGGCVIGKRPIDIHLKALEQMGVTFRQDGSGLVAEAENGILPATTELGFPSVGATENIVMAATAAPGVTRILGAAREPEVQALCEFLNLAGAKIEGIGSSELVIYGGMRLRGCCYEIPADRIVAGTYLLAGFAARGSMFLENAPVSHMGSVLAVAERMGAGITVAEDGIYAQFPERPKEFRHLETDVYPGFPTDLQSIFLAVRCTGKGRTVLRERIFENRFRVVESLQAMGACIKQLDAGTVSVCGVTRLRGNAVEAYELRGGAALVAAALGAEGETIVNGRRFIDRGYENICRDLRELGARIVSE